MFDRIIKPNITFFLFLGYFAFYICLGMIITYPGEAPYNLILDADNQRVFSDLTKIDHDHYRISVHPLLLFLIQPVMLLTAGITHNSLLAVVLVQSACGATSVALLMSIFNRLNISFVLSVCLCLIFGFSFSTMLFSSVPETFIFAGTSLIGFCYFIMILLDRSGDLNKREFIGVIFFGTFCFGITITNYLFFIIGISILSKYRKGIKRRFCTFALCLITTIGIALLLCVIQSAAWPQCPTFWDSIIKASTGEEKYEELNYISAIGVIKNPVGWITQFALLPIISSHPELLIMDDGFYFIAFSSYGPLRLSIVVLFYMLVLFSIVIGIRAYLQGNTNIKYAKSLRNNTANLILLLVSLGWISQFVLHLFYGSQGSFLYSQHNLFMLFIIFAISANSLRGRIYQACTIVLCAFVPLEAILNCVSFRETAQLLMRVFNFSYDPGYALLISIVCCFFFGLFIFVINRCLKDKRERAKGGSYLILSPTKFMYLLFESYCLVTIMGTVFTWLQQLN